ncbi:MAG: amidohydrolase family protein [SAR202 cluster bacterium]|jgi:imidazolonepropionase-like amidohydrolase|nr:amidohydrolase family protein [SAR202 cluster bacterium]MDP6715606.1 amidohydrolase family protein [SAR202 cluster bacterium]
MKVITGGLLIDGTGSEPVPNASVVINDDGRIESVGPLDSKPRGAEVIDASGHTIMPGLIDCHVHMMSEIKPMQERALTPLSLQIIQATQNARATLDAGVTTVRDAGGTPMGFKMAAEQGLVASPRMRISVGALSQTGGHGDSLLPSGVKLSLTGTSVPLPEWPETLADGPEEVRKVVRTVLRAGADFIKLHSSGGVLSPSDEPGATQFTREEIAVMVYEARAQGKTCMAHAQSTEGIRNAVVTGVESIEHGIYLDESVIAEMKERGTFLVPTLVAPVWVIRRAEQQPGSILPQSLRKSKEVQADHMASFRMALESGVRIAMGTDTAVGPHGTNVEELRLMVENGMTPMQSIVASTKTASEAVHMSNDIGTLEAGKLADILVVNGNPLEDISTLEDQDNLRVIMQGGGAHKDTLER